MGVTEYKGKRARRTLPHPREAAAACAGNGRWIRPAKGFSKRSALAQEQNQPAAAQSQLGVDYLSPRKSFRGSAYSLFSATVTPTYPGSRALTTLTLLVRHHMFFHGACAFDMRYVTRWAHSASRRRCMSRCPMPASHAGCMADASVVPWKEPNTSPFNVSCNRLTVWFLAFSYGACTLKVWNTFDAKAPLAST